MTNKISIFGRLSSSIGRDFDRKWCDIRSTQLSTVIFFYWYGFFNTCPCAWQWHIDRRSSAPWCRRWGRSGRWCRTPCPCSCGSGTRRRRDRGRRSHRKPWSPQRQWRSCWPRCSIDWCRWCHPSRTQVRIYCCKRYCNPEPLLQLKQQPPSCRIAQSESSATQQY